MDLTIKRGQTETFEFDLYTPNGSPYSFLGGDTATFRVYTDQDLTDLFTEVTGTFSVGGYTVEVVVPAAATEDLTAAKTLYYWKLDTVTGGSSDVPVSGTVMIEATVLLPVPIDPVVRVARDRLRDFPRPFRQDIVSHGTDLAYELQVPNVSTANPFKVYHDDGSSLTALTPDQYVLDARNGMLTTTAVPAGDTVVVTGYHYDWVTDEDLRTYVGIALSNYRKVEGDEALKALMLKDETVNLLALAGVVETLWALLLEFSRDIDVSSPETDIPATQRYRQAYQMWLTAQDELEDLEQALNIGINRIQMFNLRRVSRMTNRLVPLYVPQEYDDKQFPPTRVKPPIDPGGPIEVSEA